MSVFEGIILGIVQGITEFFPVSSSGHLVIFQHFFGIKEGSLLFEVMVHFGTLLAVIYVYRRDILSLIKRPFQKLSYLIIAGAIPTAIIGFAFHDIFAETFASIQITALMLLVTGTILWFTDAHASGQRPIEKMGFAAAIFIGLAQGLAILPGLSRSGTTIAAALLIGLSRQDAPRYSFLLSIPVIFGATLLEAKDIVSADFNGALLLPYSIGMVAAAITGYFAINFFIRFVQREKLHYFSYYCWAMGFLVLLWQWF